MDGWKTHCKAAVPPSPPHRAPLALLLQQLEVFRCQPRLVFASLLLSVRQLLLLIQRAFLPDVALLHGGSPQSELRRLPARSFATQLAKQWGADSSLLPKLFHFAVFRPRPTSSRRRLSQARDGKRQGTSVSRQACDAHELVLGSGGMFDKFLTPLNTAGKAHRLIRFHNWQCKIQTHFYEALR
jgi:hypothetical protein